jgi:HK97 family phage prohead protease
MPWHLKQGHSGCPSSKPWAVVLDATGKVVGCHVSKKDAQAHLAALNIHAKEAPPMTERAELHAEAARARAGSLGEQRAALPCGEATREDVKFGTEFRAETVQRDGRDFILVEGYASMTERAYEMWDQFGPYNEVVARSAFDKTLSTPDLLVVFRFNHSGMPMASTRNGRLELGTDSTGFRDRAWLNPQRDDVQRLHHGIVDEDVTEQSFMFHIDEGTWNDDFTEYRINRVNMDRGDVGPVTYGANPHTVIAARSGELLAAIPELPPLVAREAYRLLRAQYGPATPEPVADTAEPPDSGRDTRKSLRLALAQLELDKTIR